MRKLACMLLVLGGACAHQAASNMSARVVEQTAPGAAMPVRGAHVVMHCPDGMNEDLGTTGSDGLLRISPSIAPALDCKLTVAEPGYSESTASVGDVCTARAANVCTALSLNAVLHRRGSAGY